MKNRQRIPTYIVSCLLILSLVSCTHGVREEKLQLIPINREKAIYRVNRAVVDYHELFSLLTQQGIPEGVTPSVYPAHADIERELLQNDYVYDQRYRMYTRMVDGVLTNQSFWMPDFHGKSVYNGKMLPETTLPSYPAIEITEEDIRQIRRMENRKIERRVFDDPVVAEGEDLAELLDEHTEYCKLSDGIHKMKVRKYKVFTNSVFRTVDPETGKAMRAWDERSYWYDVFTGKMYTLSQIQWWESAFSELSGEPGASVQNKESQIFSELPQTEQLLKNQEKGKFSLLAAETFREVIRDNYAEIAELTDLSLSEIRFVRQIDEMLTNQEYSQNLDFSPKNREEVLSRNQPALICNPITIRDDQIEEYRKSIEGKTALTQHDAPEPYFGEEPLQEKRRETVVFLLKDGLHQLEQITYTVLGAGTLTFEDGTTGKYRGEVTYWYDAFTGRQLSENEIDWWKS